MIHMSDKLVSLYAIDNMLSKLSGMYHIEDIRGMISRMPGAEIETEAAGLVHCEECKLWGKKGCPNVPFEDYCPETYPFPYMEKRDFCSRGKRKVSSNDI